MGWGLSVGGGVAAAGLLLCACGTAPPRSLGLGRPRHGISEGAAIAAARAFGPAGQDPVISVRVVNERDLVSAGDQSGADRFVWAVVFRGGFLASCGPAPLPGHPVPTWPPPPTTLVVFVDYVTGRALDGESPAPPEPLPPSASLARPAESALVASSRRPPASA